jgi:hypothetical protein
MCGAIGIIDCPDCGGEGQIFTGMVGSRWSIDPPCETYRPCEHCRGHGVIEGLPDLIDEWDLDEIPLATVAELEAIERETRT